VNYDDEKLMAYADGELEPDERAAIEAAIAQDPALAERVRRHRRLRLRVADAFGPVIDQPVPERLVDAAKGIGPSGDSLSAPRAQVLSLPSRRGRAGSRAWGLPQWAAMAASLVLGVIVSWQALQPREPALVASDGGLVARGILARALQEQRASAQSMDDPVHIGITFRTQEGGYCRSFTLRAARTAGLACRTQDEWRVEVTATADDAAGGMRQAASPPAAVLQVIEARIAGEPLDAVGEADAQGRGWTRPR
jgi:hypothetical protein